MVVMAVVMTVTGLCWRRDGREVPDTLGGCRLLQARAQEHLVVLDIGKRLVARDRNHLGLVQEIPDVQQQAAVEGVEADWRVQAQCCLHGGDHVGKARQSTTATAAGGVIVVGQRM